MHQRYYGQKTFIDLTQDDGGTYDEHAMRMMLAEVRNLRNGVRDLREDVQDLMVWNLGEKK